MCHVQKVRFLVKWFHVLLDPGFVIILCLFFRWHMMVFFSWLYFGCIIVLGYHHFKIFFSSEIRKMWNWSRWLCSSLIVLLCHPLIFCYCQLCVRQGGTMLGPPDTVVDLGETEVSEEIFMDYLSSLGESTYRFSNFFNFRTHASYLFSS